MSSEPIYSLRVLDVFKALETSPDGLLSVEAQARQSLYGENRLSEQFKESIFEKFYKQFLHPATGILAVAAILAFVRGDLEFAILQAICGGFARREFHGELSTGHGELLQRLGHVRGEFFRARLA